MALTAEQYTVAWLCALPESEQVAARLALDERHQDPPRQFDDENSYFFGSIGGHNIVIGCLPPGQPGLVSASRLIGPMSRSFKNLKIYLFVGIGGGVPHQPPCENADDDIHLGDVVIGHSEVIGAPAVVQWDFGRRLEGSEYENTSNLDKPDRRLLSALGSVITNDECGEAMFDRHLNNIITKNSKFKYPGLNNDKLFDAAYQHGKSEDCSMCDSQRIVSRPSRDSTKLVYHRGTIMSGNSVMKNGIERDIISKKHNARCFEMEAAGVMDATRCLVIRGIADYADGHKNWIWHRYAAAAAAAFAKEFLLTLKPVVLEDLTPKVPQLDHALQAIQEIASQMEASYNKEKSRSIDDELRKCHQVFKKSPYEQFKNNNPERIPGTCLWVLEHSQYKEWIYSQNSDLLWISADPGCGKSVLSRSLIEKELQTTNSRSTCYFFFKDNEQQDRLTFALCALLHQLFDMQPLLLKYAKPRWDINGEKLSEETNELWRILMDAAADRDSHEIICVLDALDECRESDRRILLGLLSEFYSGSFYKKPGRKSLKFLVTSRPYDDIERGFQAIRPYLPKIRLSGERENEKIHKEIDLVIEEKVRKLAIDNSLRHYTTETIRRSLLRMEHRTYLWLYLAFESIEDRYRNSLFPDLEAVESLQLPVSVEDAYEKILSRITEDQKPTALQILGIIVGAYRPLDIAEMAIALGLVNKPNPQTYAEIKININLEDYIRRLCGLFVFVKDAKIYLLHQTAKEFLVQKQPKKEGDVWKWKHCLSPADSEITMAHLCIDYLALKELDDMEIHTTTYTIEGKILESVSGIGAFLRYSAQHWSSHFRNSSTKGDIVAKVLSLYQADRRRLNLWFRILWKSEYYSEYPLDMSVVALAAFNGHDVVLHDLLKTGFTNLKEKDITGRTALIWAAERGFVKAVRILLEEQTDINAQGGRYGNALQAASAGGYTTIVKLLLYKGANVNAQGGDYGYALHAASSNGHWEIVQLLLHNKADVNATGGDYGSAIQTASFQGHQEIIQLLLNNKANINAISGRYNSALQAASFNGHQKTVQLLLNNKADINTIGGFYGSALQAASSEGHQETVQLLLNNGADINATGGDYGSALQAASFKGHYEIVQLLLNNGANINILNGYYSSAIHAASFQNHQNIIQLLLNNGADINITDSYRGTALQVASLMGHQEVVQLLLDNGADVNITGGIHDSAIQAALSNGHQEIIQLLQDQGGQRKRQRLDKRLV